MRMPKVDTLQKLAAALEVTSSFLLGEEDSDVDIPEGLARQSLKLFLRDNALTRPEIDWLRRVSGLNSAPQCIRGWRDLLSNFSVR